MTGPLHILITGRPGSGKTTLIRTIAERLADRHPAGFYTAEIREQSVRKGFELVSLDGRKALLAHVSIGGPYRVGKYGVDIAAFEAFLDALQLTAPGKDLIVIDEIGRMECLSEKFVALVRDLFVSRAIIIATVAQKGGGPIREVKERTDVTLHELTAANRETLVRYIVQAFRSVPSSS